jgi:hypothetical protein
MRRIARLAAFAAAIGLAQAAAAQTAPAVVEAVQMPAWIERDGIRQPVSPGMSVRAADSLRTGPDARLLLKLAEGSSVKLGENAEFRLDAIAVRPASEQGLFVAAMNVVKGAFRYTTALVARPRPRDVSIRFVTVTAGIRGTDVWGKSAEDREIVCLIEGRIQVQREGETAFSMSDPLSFYIAPRGQPALPVQPVPAAQLAQWATETDIQTGKGAARRGGAWKVVVAAGESENTVLDVYQAVREAGYAVELNPVRRDGRRIYEARITSLPSQAEAQALAAALDGRYGVARPQVTR